MRRAKVVPCATTAFQMKLRITIKLAVVLIFVASAGAAERHADFQAAGQLTVEKKKDLLLDYTCSDWCGCCKRLKQEGFDHPGSPSFFLTATDKEQKDGKAKADKQRGSVPGEEAFGRALAALADIRKQLEDLQKKIEEDHSFWERSSEQMKESRERIAQLEVSLAKERQQFGKLRQSLARIEREHNGDHAREQALALELAKREKALEAFEAKEDKISRLEKEAAQLRRQVDKLRQRADELGKE